MNQTQAATNPLDQLKDIHTPDVIQQIQLAPGWWILIAAGLLLVTYLFYRLLKRRKALRLLVPANNELNQIAQKTPDNLAMAELSGLLKRVCLIYFPKQQVAPLSGEQWTNFLNQQVGRELFNQQQQTIFSQLAYRANQQIERSLWLDIINNSRIAINTIIKNSAKQSSKLSTKKSVKQKGQN